MTNERVEEKEKSAVLTESVYLDYLDWIQDRNLKRNKYKHDIAKKVDVFNFLQNLVDDVKNFDQQIKTRPNGLEFFWSKEGFTNPFDSKPITKEQLKLVRGSLEWLCSLDILNYVHWVNITKLLPQSYHHIKILSRFVIVFPLHHSKNIQSRFFHSRFLSICMTEGFGDVGDEENYKIYELTFSLCWKLNFREKKYKNNEPLCWDDYHSLQTVSIVDKEGTENK